MKSVRRVLLLSAVAAVVLFVYKLSARGAPPAVLQATVTSGPIAMTVSATGTIQAARTVDVGTQVTGTVKRLSVDYNSIVKRGEVIAEIDPQLSEAAVTKAQATLDAARIDLTRDQAQLSTDTLARDREVDLLAHDIASEQDRDSADLQVDVDQAVVDRDQAAIVVASAGVEQAKVTLAYCTIRSPIDGVVIARNADEGQTVTASLSVPSLYVIATDLDHLQMAAQVDEADIGTLHPGQDVSFTVDAYRGQTFHGTLQQVRLSATTTNNVVTYQAIVAIANPGLKLLPSMTTRLSIAVANVATAVRIPRAALRFRPTQEVFSALGQPPVPVPSPFAETPTRLAVPPLPLPKSPVAAVDPSGHVEIDARFGPTPHPRTGGSVWVFDAGRLRRVAVVVGLQDDTWSELLSGDLAPGQSVVSDVVLPRAPRTMPASPFTPPRGARGGFRR